MLLMSTLTASQARANLYRLIDQAARDTGIDRNGEQRGSFEADGSWVLEVPYSDPRELVMDILKYGADVEVVSPGSLRKHVHSHVAETLELYD